MTYNLKNRVVFITGASGGIGRACAVEYHRAGARVAAVARSTDKLEALASSLGVKRVLPVTADVTDSGQRESALAVVRDRFGPIDVLVNNAGWASFTSVMRTPPDHLDRMLSLNLVSPITLIQAVLPEMLERGSGQIVNIASVVGFQAIPRMTVYSATKAALISLSTGLRMELRGSGVDVIMVAPGSTRTDFFDAAAKVDADATRFARSQYSADRVGRAVLRASRRRHGETLLTTEGKAIATIRRFSHRLADLTMYLVAKRSMPTLDAFPGSTGRPTTQPSGETPTHSGDQPGG